MYGVVITVIVCGTVIILAAMGSSCYRSKMKIERLRLRKMNQKDPAWAEDQGCVCRKSASCSPEGEEQYNGSFTGFYVDADGNMLPVEPRKLREELKV